MPTTVSGNSEWKFREWTFEGLKSFFSSPDFNLFVTEGENHMFSIFYFFYTLFERESLFIGIFRPSMRKNPSTVLDLMS